MSSTQEDIKKFLVQTVTDRQGCKGTELVTLLADFLGHANGILNILDELVKEGKLAEVEYTLPNLSYRTKSYYFPAETEICLKGNVR